MRRALADGLSRALATPRVLVHDRGRVTVDLACAIVVGARVIFYRILDQLSATMGGPPRLRECPGDSGCPPQGVYFFFNVPARADRGYLERNSIALLSCLTGGPDLPSTNWLGHYAERAEIRESGLWNVQHVSGHYEPGFLRQLAQLVTHKD